MPDATHRQRNLLIVIVAVAILLRLAAAFLLGNTVRNLPGTADQLSYHNLALRLLGGHGFTFGEPWWPATQADAPTAHWSYLYTFYLTAVYALFGPQPLVARLTQAALVGLLQPLLAFWLGRRIFNPAAGLFAAALTAVYAYFIYYAGALMTESFYITAILASFVLVIKLAFPGLASPNLTGLADLSGFPRSPSLKLAAALGLTLGAAVLLRQLFLLFIPFLFLWLLLAGRRYLLPLIVSGGIIVLMILPFTAFNYARFGRFVLLNTNAGFAFFWGNHPIYGTQFQPILPRSMGTYEELIPQDLRGLDEAALDSALLARAIGFIRDDPQRYILLSLSRIPSYFVFWPSSESSGASNLARVASFGVMWPFMLYGLLLSFFRRTGASPPFSLRPPSSQILLYVFILVYTAIHILTWTLIRYRLPVDAILLLFAGLALFDLVERIPALRRFANLLWTSSPSSPTSPT